MVGDLLISVIEIPFDKEPFLEVGVFALSLKYKSSRLRFMNEILLLNAEFGFDSSNPPKVLVGDMPPVLTPGTVRGKLEKFVSGLLNISFRAFVSLIYCDVTDVPPFGNLSLNLTTGVLGVLMEEFIIAFTLLLPAGIGTRAAVDLREEGETDLWVFTLIPPVGDVLSSGLRLVPDVVVAVLLATDDPFFVEVIPGIDFIAATFPGTRETGTAMLAPELPFVAFRVGCGLALYAVRALNLFIASMLLGGDFSRDF